MADVESFSSGYFRARLVVTTYDDGPVVDRAFYESLLEDHYKRTDAPPMFRLGLDGNPYFEVDAEYTIPADHIGIPEQWFADQRMDDDYGERDVFITKPGYSWLFQQAKWSSNRFDPRQLEEGDE